MALQSTKKHDSKLKGNEKIKVETPKKIEEKKTENVETKKDEKKVEKKKQEIKPKELAVANAFGLKISTKNSIAICRMIMNKTPEKAIEILNDVAKKKKAVPMPQREVAHQKRAKIVGSVGGGAKFPVNAAKEIAEIVKQLNANCVVNSVENPVIVKAISNIGSRPYRRQGQRGKRTHLYLEARDRTKLKVRKN